VTALCIGHTRRGLPCSRRATIGAYCKQHDPSTVKARRSASDAEWLRGCKIAQMQQERRRLARMAFDCIADNREIPLGLIEKIKDCAACLRS